MLLPYFEVPFIASAVSKGEDPFLPVAPALRSILSLELYGRYCIHHTVRAQLRTDPKLPFWAEDTNEASDPTPVPAAKGKPLTKELSL